jgi:cytidylate kinase
MTADHPVVAVDGRAASGKSTVALLLARRLGAVTFDTGLLYRALALAALRHGVSESDPAGLVALVPLIETRIQSSGSGSERVVRIYLDGADVTDLLHGIEIEASVPHVARHTAVRNTLLEPQRRAVGAETAVVAGRDMGTVVFPDAELKVYLEASAEERARRRATQRDGGDREFQEVLAAILSRDKTDAAQSRPAADAVQIETEHLPADRVVDLIIGLLRARTGGDDGGGR